MPSRARAALPTGRESTCPFLVHLTPPSVLSTIECVRKSRASNPPELLRSRGLPSNIKHREGNLNPGPQHDRNDRELLETNRRFYDPLWEDARLVDPERFNTWPLVSSLLPVSPR